MNLMAADPTVLNSTAMRPIRTASGPFIVAYDSLLYGGLGRKEYKLQKELKKEKQARVTQRKKLDENYVNKSQLRKSRSDKLQALLESGVPTVSYGQEN